METSIPFEKNESTDLFKSKRTEYAVEIRKKKTEEIINIKRIKLASAKHDEKIFETVSSVSARTLSEQFLNSVAVKNVELARNATEAVRISLCTTPDKSEPYILEYLESGVAKILIMFLEESNKCFPELQCDASWALSNIIASSSYCVTYVVKNGIIEKVLAAIQFGKDKFLENCLWIMANLAGDSIELRDELLKHDLVKKVTQILCQDSHENEKIKTCAWLLSNLAHGKPFPPLEKFLGCLSILAQLMHSSDERIVEHVLWCFNCISEEGSRERLAAVCGVGVIPKTVKLLLKTKTERIADLAFRLCGNIAMGSEKIEVLLEHGFLNILSNSLDSLKKLRRKEACWIICNVAAEKSLLEKLFQSDVLAKTISVMQKDDLDVRVEATHIIKNTLDNCSNEQLEQLVKRGLIEALLRNLEMHNPVSLIDVSLEVLHKMLHFGNTLLEMGSHQLNIYSNKIYEMKGNVVLEKLQKHPNPNIYQKILKLFDDYFTFDILNE